MCHCAAQAIFVTHPHNVVLTPPCMMPDSRTSELPDLITAGISPQISNCSSPVLQTSLQSIATYMRVLLPSLRLFNPLTAATRASLRPRIPPKLSPFVHQQAANMSTAMASRLKGKTIVITGASSGIGKSTAIEFARTQPDELKLILTARREDALKEVAKEIEGFAEGVKVLAVKLDVSKPEEVQSFVGNLPEEFRDIDVLVNNA
jgi:hypothetical protein